MARTTSTKRAQRGKARWEKKATTKSRKQKRLDDREPQSRPRLANGVSERVPRTAAVAELPSEPNVARSAKELDGASLTAPSAELDFELTFEHEFFTSLPPPAPSLDFVEESNPVEERLSLAEHGRRMLLRRRVSALMLFLAAFTALALLLRLVARSG